MRPRARIDRGAHTADQPVSRRAPSRWACWFGRRGQLVHGAHHGQTTAEYAVFIAVVSAALIAMSLYIRRSVQANLKVLETQVNAEALL